ncbi:hypothetical protein N9769_06855 [Ascidiaceihabitans sp.]|nr:hypothetical protein [Ascidiaceihabitans sp.]
MAPLAFVQLFWTKEAPLSRVRDPITRPKILNVLMQTVDGMALLIF